MEKMGGNSKHISTREGSRENHGLSLKKLARLTERGAQGRLNEIDSKLTAVRLSP